jgi:hypothetical protein
MAAPNVNSPTRVEFKSALLAATTASQTIVSCGAASDMAIRVVSLVAANIDGSNAADVTVTMSDGTATSSIVRTVTVPADATLVIASRENPIHLPEGWTLAGLASAASDIEFTTAHEEIT